MEQAQQPPVQKPAAPVAPAQGAQGQDAMKQKAGEVAQRFIAAAMKLLYSSKEAAAAVVDMVAQAQSPEDGLAHASMAIMGRIQDSVKGVNPLYVFAIAPMVIAMIAELAAAAKVIEPTPEVLSAALEKIKPLIAQASKGGQKPAPQQAAQPAQQAPGQPAAPGIVAAAMEA